MKIPEVSADCVNGVHVRYNILVVHAGLLPDVPLHEQQLLHMTKMRDVHQAPDGR